MPVPTSEPTGIARPAQEQLVPGSPGEQQGFIPNQVDQLPQRQSFTGGSNGNSPAGDQRSTPTLRGVVFAESGGDGKRGDTGGGKVTAVFNEAQTDFNVNGITVSNGGTITLAGGSVLVVDGSGNLVVAGQTMAPSDLSVAQPADQPTGSYGASGSGLDGAIPKNGTKKKSDATPSASQLCWVLFSGSFLTLVIFL